MAVVWTKMVSFLGLVLTLLKLSSALLEPNPFPETLKECYDFRSYNMTPSDEVALMIQNHCFKNYQYKQIADGKVWSAPNITQEGMNYINSLFRKLFGENGIIASSKSKHHKRQAAVRFRREVRSPGAFAPFVNCIQDLYRKPAQSDPPMNKYQVIAALHTGQVLQSAHGGAAFLPWHRIYLLLLETACKGVPVPYWDSTVDHVMPDPTRSIVWSEQFFGNGDGQVMTGPFQNFQTNIPGDFLTREIGTSQNALFTKEGLAAVLSRRRYSEIIEPKRGREYVFSLEGHHNGPHNWVGGHLPLAWVAAYDPVFFMHHAYVDAVWEVFRAQQARNGIDPERDYPLQNRPGHGPYDIIDFRPYFQPIRNIDAMSQAIARLVRYEPFPSCQNNCNSSPFLTCVRGVCMSRARSAASPMESFGGAAAFGPSDQDAPSQSRVLAQARGPIPGGERFRSSPFMDTRNRPNTIGNAPVAPELEAASFQARTAGMRSKRDVSKILHYNVSSNAHVQSVSSLERSYTNTFIMDGVIDVKRWVYVPVRVVYNRTNANGNDPTFKTNILNENSNEMCRAVGSGASKVYVASNGLNYFGAYKEFAIIDERQPISETTTAVGIKNPDYGTGEVMFSAYDSCGRTCRPLCLTSIQGRQKYISCSGVFKISSAEPKMFKRTYRDVFALDISLDNSVAAETEDEPTSPSITFLCDENKHWPWVY